MEKRRITITLLRMLVLTMEMAVMAVMGEAKTMAIPTAEAAAMTVRTTDMWLCWSKREDGAMAIEMPDTRTP